MPTSEQVIDKTKKWINNVVVGCNFCPFAANVMRLQSVHYQVETSTELNDCLSSVSDELTRLDNSGNIETSFLIFQNSFVQFDDFLHLISMAEKILKEKGYEGIYQLASFHPLYRFADSKHDDPADYTNRSIYPMLHFLREESIDKALEHYSSPENIPARNVDFARKKGLAYMKMLRDTCFND
jgi:hypothetical protein